jgi:alpha-methylacyl-CoA racemase
MTVDSTNGHPAPSGPLHGIRVIELAGMGPGPHAAMQLADMGADVVRVQRPGQPLGPSPRLRGRRLVEADLKDSAAVARVLSLIERADVLIEGFRPGVTERLGLGPDECRRRNPRLIYTRVTGWGQSGPRALEAGHDINYISVTGLLHAMGSPDRPPTPPLNLVGDYGGGSMFAVVGILAALVERSSSGTGQIVDAAIVDGVLLLGHVAWTLRADGRWSDDRGSNIFDGSAPFYRTYECSDGRFVAVGALEPEFFAELLRILDIDPQVIGPQRDAAGWAAMHDLFSRAFLDRTRDHWARLFAGTDACVTPVYTVTEAMADPHLRSRGTFVDVDGHRQPGPAPRLSRTPSKPRSGPSAAESIDSVWQ